MDSVDGINMFICFYMYVHVCVSTCVCNNNKDKEGVNFRGGEDKRELGGWKRKDANAVHIYKI